MKYFCISVFITLIAACAAASAPVMPQALLVLPSGKFMTGGVTTDFASAMRRLGPPNTTQVNLTFCPTIDLATASKVKADVEAAGYSHISFATVDASDSALCANKSFKADGFAAA